jgi:hypothetical protein
MDRKTKSLLCGVAVAALVIAPSVPGFGQSMPHPAPAPSAPSMPPMPPAPPMPPMPPMHGHGSNWTVGSVHTFNTNSLKLEDVVGTVIVTVRDSGPMAVQISGARERVAGVEISQDDGRLHIEASSDGDDDRSVWDWKNWLNFHTDDSHESDDLTIKVTVPRGSDVNVEDLVGNATIGDTMGNLRFEAASSNAHIGKVAKAKISLGGSGRIDVASVTGLLDVEIGGSGKLVAGPTGSVKADIAGSGDAQLGAIAGGLSVDIAGSGDITAAHVNGPTHIDIAGSGTVRIADGIANPLHVDIMGAGNLYFGGVAVDPHIDAVGSGTVHLKAYRGKLDSEGMADVKVGD